MERFFTEILNRGMEASLLVLVLVLLRACFKRMPKRVCLVLWCFVAFRLLCPVSLETSFSLMPDVEKFSRTVEESMTKTESETSQQPDVENPATDNVNEDAPDIMAGLESGSVGNNDTVDVNSFPNASPVINMAESSETVVEEPSEEKKELPLLPMVWLVGVVFMAFYGVVSYWKVKRKVKAFWNVKENIFYCDDIETPFVFGLFKPGIYLPSGIEEATAEYVLRHEKEHLRRGDQWWKLLGFAMLAAYWFHPALWVAYLLFCKDIEFACDERVIKGMEERTRREYARALLSCSIGKRVILLCPTAFGETGVKSRIRSVMTYKKATIPVLAGAAVICFVVAIGFLTDRRDPYGIDAEDIVMEDVTLKKTVAEDIAEEIAALMVGAGENSYELKNFQFTFHKLDSAQENRLLRVSVSADKTSLRAPEDSPVIAGMKKAQSELTYEAERNYAQRMIDSMLAQMKQEAEIRICEPAIFVTLDEKNNYELCYGDANRTPLKDYFKKEDAGQEEFLGYLSVYQKANIEPPMDVTGSYGYCYVDALNNPENKMTSLGLTSSSVYLNNSFLYYKEGVYDDIAVYEVKDKEKLPWELLGEEIKTAYSNNGEYWSERDALVECTGEGTLYQIKGYEDTYRVALVYEQNWRNDAYIEQQLLTTDIRPKLIFQSVIGQAKEVEIQSDRTTYHMVICEHVNGLWFHEGRAVFQQRIHLENAVSVNGLSMEEELLWNFLAELNAATFAPVTTRGDLEYENIIFTDALGMEHSLKLNEEGYVKVQACATTLNVKIDEEICRRVMEQVRAYEAQQPLVSWEDAFPVQAVLNQEEGFVETYDELLEQAKSQLFDKNLPSAWFGETGYYISKVPVYYYNASQGKLNSGANLLFLSKDFDKSSSAYVGWSYAEPTVSSGFWNQEILEMMKASPAEEYIIVNGLVTVNGLPGMVILDEENNDRWSSFRADREVTLEDSLYQRLYSDELAISYEELTAEENLIWISVTGDAADATPTPTPTPVDIANRMYQSEYEKSPYAAYSAEEWLKSGRLEVPFAWEDVLKAQLMSERYAMYYIPEEALCQASTVDLARVAAFDYRFGAFGNYPSDYLEIARSKFNAFDALFAREDMVEALLKVYKANGFYLTSVATTTEMKKEASRQEEGIVMLEILLATDEAFDKMNGQQEKVLQEVQRKMKQRETGLYDCDTMLSGFFAYIKENAVLGSKWYDYIMKNHTDDEKLQYYLENVCYPGDPIVMDSRLPEEDFGR